MESDQKLISIIIPAYNEEKNIPLVYHELQGVFSSLPNYQFEIIFVNDGSEDATTEIIEKICADDQHVSQIEFSRNFGKELATTAGIHHAKGDAVIIMDADMQHPPKMLAEFLAKWEKGAEVVVGVRKYSKKEKLLKRLGSLIFYKIMDRIGDTQIVPNSTDFRLLDRIVVTEFNRLTERNRMTRGLIAWLGFHRDFVYFIADERANGQPRYSFPKLIKLALSSFVANSLFPLKLAGYLGMTITFLSGLLGLFILIERYALGDPLGFSFSGPAILAVINLFLIGIVLSCLGLVALYIANINGEVINRPLYIIRKKKNK